MFLYCKGSRYKIKAHFIGLRLSTQDITSQFLFLKQSCTESAIFYCVIIQLLGGSGQSNTLHCFKQSHLKAALYIFIDWALMHACHLHQQKLHVDSHSIEQYKTCGDPSPHSLYSYIFERPSQVGFASQVRTDGSFLLLGSPICGLHHDPCWTLMIPDSDGHFSSD